MEHRATEPRRVIPWNLLIQIIVIVIIIYRLSSPIHEEDCRQLISPSLDNVNRPWTPRGCSVVPFNQSMARHCLGNHSNDPPHMRKRTSFIFMGDSHERNMMSVLLQMVSRKRRKPIGKLSETYRYIDDELNFQALYLFRPAFNDQFPKTFAQWKKNNFVPDLLVIGCNLHPILDFNASNEALVNFKLNLTQHFHVLNAVAAQTTTLWYVQPPVKEEIIKANRKIITNRQVNMYNDMVINVLQKSFVHLWTSPKLIAEDNLDSYQDDVHVGKKSVQKYVQVLLNFFCNSKLGLGLANEDSCCRKMQSNDKYIFATSICLCLLLFITFIQSKFPAIHDLTLLVHTRGYPTDKSKEGFCHRFLMFLIVCTKMMIYLLFIYACCGDLFERAEKYTLTSPAACLGVLCFSVAVLATLKEVPDNQEVSQIFVQEARGLVIALLICLRFSQCLPFWTVHEFSNILQTLVIFMAGLNFFLDFWNVEQNSGFSFYLNHLWTQNALMVALLCLPIRESLMKESFIFGIIWVSFHLCYFTLVCPPWRGKTQGYGALLSQGLRLVIAGALISGVSLHIKVWTEWVSGRTGWSNIFRIRYDEIRDWEDLWNQNKYSYVSGVCCGILLKYESIICPKVDILREFSKTWLSKVSFFLTGSILVIGSLLFVIQSSSAIQYLNKPSYEFRVFSLILGYIFIRKSLQQQRCKVSTFLTWLGELWVEVILLTFFWIANNGTTVLQLIASSPFINLVLVVASTFSLAYECHIMLKLCSYLLSIQSLWSNG